LVRRIGSCDPLTDSAPGAEPLVEVSIDEALSGSTCGSEPGSVERFEVTPPNGIVESATCGETITLRGLEVSGATVTLPLRAFEAGATQPTWGSTCLAEVIAGVTTRASCLPLDDKGVLEVDPEAALAALGLECSASAFVELDVLVSDDDEPKIVTPSNCNRPLQFGDLAPGAATARASARLADGSQTAETLCTGTIAPGETARADCTAPP
jgi:hypothetical protein